jgi:hypothetical protein
MEALHVVVYGGYHRNELWDIVVNIGFRWGCKAPEGGGEE